MKMENSIEQITGFFKQLLHGDLSEKTSNSEGIGETWVSGETTVYDDYPMGLIPAALIVFLAAFMLVMCIIIFPWNDFFDLSDPLLGKLYLFLFFSMTAGTAIVFLNKAYMILCFCVKKGNRIILLKDRVIFPDMRGFFAAPEVKVVHFTEVDNLRLEILHTPGFFIAGHGSIPACTFYICILETADGNKHEISYKEHEKDKTLNICFFIAHRRPMRVSEILTRGGKLIIVKNDDGTINVIPQRDCT